jgi:hypothetical protein
MPSPSQPVTFSVEQLADLHRKLRDAGHDINNYLANITAAVELSRLKPENTKHCLSIIMDQSPKIQQAVKQFVNEFERSAGITRP